MDNTTINLLSNALDFGSARMQALSNNLSNVNTPGYKRKDASFDSVLAAARGENQDDTLTMRVTDNRDIALPDDGAPKANPAIITTGGGAMRPDGNNVDIDSESTRMAAAQIYYQGAAQLVSGQFSALKYVIGGGK
ncbi:flagellar basal body rod protein FlgB [Capsulimonas corticalis]|uniref:Flagellar basal body rod protein FlgB n=1 Tax=Capsulimonas corticalis TaxID=2219043 RepID=A0A402CSX6_9BACT|nr:flagellar basal body rod protein FlgB [Capsulimonas corticalis]BDI30920.1 flagellar basal body rod protein FlgB [Capsulimonas corticalis]